MGYTTPSAEDVYRRAFRLDGHPSLTDRFGFSIVLVNDQSAECRELLRRYCMDLCLRTADRIRFIFFSEIPDAQFAMLDPPGRIRSGLLRRVLGSIPRSADSEDAQWSALRPPELRPLRNVGEIDRALSVECDRHTALPGAGAAMEFAHRLGVGALVPCVVAFSEIGERQIHVLPIDGMRAETVFAHLRDWIDSFYAQNRHEIERWAAVEREIERLGTEHRRTLYEINDWRERVVGDWSELRRVSGAIHTLESADPDAWRALVEPDAIQPLRPATREALRSLRELDERQRRVAADTSALASARASVAEAAGYDEIAAALHECQVELPQHLHPESLQAGIQALRRLRPSPRTQVEHWWKACQSAFPLSSSKYSRLRSPWRERGRDVGSHGKVERRRLIEALERSRILDPSAAVATSVVEALASCLEMPSDAESFTSWTSALSSELTRYLRHVRRQAPPWLLELEPSITFGDALPFGVDWNRASVADEHRPALRRATLAASDGLHQVRSTAAVGCRDAVTEALESAASALPTPDQAIDEAKLSALTLLQPLRRQIAGRAFAADALQIGLRRAPSPESLAELHAALDEYDRAVAQIRFPYVEDPATIALAPSMPLARAAAIERRPPVYEPAIALRRQLAKASDADREQRETKAQAVREVTDAAPLRALAQAFERSDARPEARAIVAEIAGGVTPSRAAELVEALTRAEIAVAAAALHCAPDLTEILVALGLYACAGTEGTGRLMGQIKTDTFDVFMAHNAKDKPAVLNIARSLRSRGLYPWVDSEQVPPGRWFQDVIQAAIPLCRAAAIFVGPHGLGQWQALELQTFISQCVEHGTPVIPTLLPSVSEPPATLLFLRQLSMVRFKNGLGDTDALDSLEWGITA